MKTPVRPASDLTYRFPGRDAPTRNPRFTWQVSLCRFPGRDAPRCLLQTPVRPARDDPGSPRRMTPCSGKAIFQRGDNPRFIRRGDDPEVRQAIASSSSFLSRQREEEDTDGADRACRTTRGDHMRAGSEGRTKSNTKRVEGGVRRCLAVASRCGNDFVVSSERTRRERASEWGAKPPTPPLCFFSFSFSFLRRSSVQMQIQ